jgi:hypothetical protein
VEKEIGAILVRKELKDLFEERNDAGQTLLYCLLRFTKKPELRNKFLFAATAGQLAATNKTCGSTALMGYFWGELEKIRLAISFPGMGEEETPVADIFEILKMKSAVAVASIPNLRGETALQFAMMLTIWRTADYAKLQKLLGEAASAN